MKALIRDATDSDWRDVYGLPEKAWLGIWLSLLLLGWIARPLIGDFTEFASVALGILALVVVLPQVTSRLGRISFELGRIVLTVVSSWQTYEMASLFIDAFRRPSFELQMIAADAWLFGGNPSEWFQPEAWPWLTEYLQVVYVGYFPMMLFVGLSLIAYQKYRHFYDYMLVMNFSIFTLHLFYFLVPVRSPFLLVDITPFSEHLSYVGRVQGIWWTETLRQRLLDATTMRYDCFPSGHTMHSVLSAYFAWRVNRTVGAIVTIIAASIIVSTLYLRYHYAIDLVAGGAMAVFWIYVGRRIAERTWRSEPKPKDRLLPRLNSVLKDIAGE